MTISSLMSVCPARHFRCGACGAARPGSAYSPGRVLRRPAGRRRWSPDHHRRPGRRWGDRGPAATGLLRRPPNGSSPGAAVPGPATPTGTGAPPASHRSRCGPVRPRSPEERPSSPLLGLGRSAADTRNQTVSEHIYGCGPEPLAHQGFPAAF